MTEPPPTYVGHVIAASFGLVFVVLNSSGLDTALRLLICICAVVASAVVLAAFVRTAHAVSRQTSREDVVGFTGRFWLIVAIEAAALFGGLAVINATEPAAALGWIPVVVGLHFIPLSRLWPAGRAELLFVGLAMTLLWSVGLVIAFSTHRSPMVLIVSGVSSGVVLLGSTLVSAVATLSAGRRRGLAGPSH